MDVWGVYRKRVLCSWAVYIGGMKIKLKDIGKTYNSGCVRFCALQHVSLTIEKGTFVAVKGPSGSGIIALLSELRTQYGTTIVLTSHDERILQKADRCIALHDGTVAEA